MAQLSIAVNCVRISYQNSICNLTLFNFAGLLLTTSTLMKKEIFSFLFIATSIFCFGQNLTGLINDAEDKLSKNHWEQAFRDFNRILDKHENDLTYLQQAEVYNHLGFLNLMFLDLSEAERELNRSLTYHEEAGIPNPRSYADALINIGILYLEQVEFDLARDNIRHALDILKEKPEWTIDYLVARTKLARIYEEAGSYTLALSIYNESYDKLLVLGNDLSPDFADICSHKGRILILTGDPIEGERFINLSTTIYESLGPSYNIPRAESMEDLALFYERMGRHEDAEKLLLEILDLKRSIPDEADILIIETLNDLGIVYNRMKRYAEAEEMFQEVVLECEENIGKDHPFYATAKNNLGTIALNKGDYPKAKILLEDAIIKLKSRFGSFHPYYADVLNNLARTERKLGNTQRAESYYKEVLQIDLKLYGDRHPNYATTMLNIGILLSNDNRAKEAEQYYQAALSIREKSLGINHPAHVNALEYAGVNYIALNKFVEAEKSFRKSIQIQINQIGALFPIMREQERELLYLQVSEDVSRYNYIASQLLDTNPELVKHIFDFQAKTKTLLFNSLDKVHNLVKSSNDELLVAEYQKWLSDKRLLASYYQMGEDRLSELHVNLRVVEAEILKQEDNLKKKIEVFEEALPHENLEWRRLYEKVKAEEAIVEIIRINEFKLLTNNLESVYGNTEKCRYLAIIFNGNDKTPKFTFLGDKTISDADHYSFYESSLDTRENADEFFRLYWKPIMDLTKEAKEIKVVPDGFFYKVNPNQFKVSKKAFVFDKQYVSYLTSTHDLFQSEPMVLNNKLSIVSNANFEEFNFSEFDLTNSSVEPDSFDYLTKPNWKIIRYKDKEANEYQIRSLYFPTILHISTPTFFNIEKPFINDKTPLMSPLFNSGLFFAGVADSYQKYNEGIPSIPENDGILTVYEVMKLELDRTRLVILSSIELKDRNLSGGEGFYGLMRALTVAGARNVISSIRTIEPERKKEFLELFYDRFFETDNIQSSFKYAQLEMKNKYSDIDSWGSYILIGIGT